MTKAQRALADADILGSTYGMVDGVGQCTCEDSGGRWIYGPCNRTDPILHCREPNGVDVRLPKACCGVTFNIITGEDGTVQTEYTPYCEDVCTAKECSEKVVLNYAATFYTTGRRCFFANNAGEAAAVECELKIGDNSDTTAPPPTQENLFFPRCNNSNFICWGDGCANYVNIINNGFYYNPAVNDYRVFQLSGAASKLQDFNTIDTDKNVIGNGLFTPFTRNYLHMKSRYGRAAFITQDNKVLFTGAQLSGIINGVEYAPLNYTTDPFYKYDHVEIGKNFAIIRKTSNIGTRADFVGYLVPGLCMTESELNYSGVQTVHALEEAACVSRLNFLTNNIELLCKGYPFSSTGLSLVDGGDFGTHHYTIDPDTISCHGYHCTYQRYKLTPERTLIEKEWITSGEYKRVKDNFGNPLPIPSERITTFLEFPKSQFEDGIVVAGYNFDCFIEAVSQNEETEDGFTRLSCYGTWDPEDTNKGMNFTNHEFGILNTRPEKGSSYYDCDYNKCFAVMPTANYCEDNQLGNCIVSTPECSCTQTTQAGCDGLGGFFTQDVSCQELLEDCESEGDGNVISFSCFTPNEPGAEKYGACCVTTICPNSPGNIKYSCSCRRKGSCDALNGTFYENTTPDDPAVNCGPAETPGNCCFLRPQSQGGYVCLTESMTGIDCRQCVKIENDICVEYEDGGNPYGPGNKWSDNTNPCCTC